MTSVKNVSAPTIRCVFLVCSSHKTTPLRYVRYVCYVAIRRRHRCTEPLRLILTRLHPLASLAHWTARLF